jgi:hypothetical protein
VRRFRGHDDLGVIDCMPHASNDAGCEKPTYMP